MGISSLDEMLHKVEVREIYECFSGRVLYRIKQIRNTPAKYAKFNIPERLHL